MDAVKKTITQFVLSILLVVAFASSSQGDLPKAIFVSDFYSTGLFDDYNGIYFYSFQTTSQYGIVSTFYTKPGGFYHISDFSYYNSPPSYWYAKAIFSGYYSDGFRQEYYTTDPTKNVRWIKSGTTEYRLPPRVYAMDRPDSAIPQPDLALTPDPINTINGAMLLDEKDINISHAGMPLQFARSYNSGMTNTLSILGPAWTHNYNWSLMQTSKIVVVSGKTLTNDCIIIRTGENRTHELIQYGTAQVWRAYRDVDWSAYLDSSSTYHLDIPPSSQLLFNSNGVLNLIRDLWGNSLTLSYTNSFPSNRLTLVEHSNGDYLLFNYSGNRLEGVRTASTNFWRFRVCGGILDWLRPKFPDEIDGVSDTMAA